MNPRFYVDGYRSLMAEMDGEKDEMIAPRFMSSENMNKAADYLRDIATQLNELYQVDVDAAAELLQEAEDKVYRAQTAEKFLEEVSF